MEAVARESQTPPPSPCLRGPAVRERWGRGGEELKRERGVWSKRF